MIGAVSSKGEFYYTINNGSTNSDTFFLFLLKVMVELESKDINWRETTILMFDNAAYHRS